MLEMKSDAIVISIVIPCYNDGQFLLEAIQSVNEVQPGRHEIIIVNDGSTDQTTLDALSKAAHLGHQVIHQRNSGPGRARNQGVAVAKGSYILPLDADNRLRPDAVNRCVEMMNRNADLDVIYGDVEFFGDKSGIERIPDFDLRRLLVWNYIYASSLFRKSTWTRFGGFDEDRRTQGYEDWDFWCRIACAGGKLLHSGEVLHEYRVRKNSFGAEVAAQQSRTDAILQHIRAKKIEVSMGEYVGAFQSWEVVVENLRTRPLKTLASLATRTYFPKTYAAHLARRTKLVKTSSS